MCSCLRRLIFCSLCLQMSLFRMLFVSYGTYLFRCFFVVSYVYLCALNVSVVCFYVSTVCFLCLNCNSNYTGIRNISSSLSDYILKELNFSQVHAFSDMFISSFELSVMFLVRQPFSYKSRLAEG